MSEGRGEGRAGLGRGGMASSHHETSPAEYATRCDQGGGRVHEEPDDPLRSPFELDAHRVACCTAFRRLEHKTQVFAPEVHDHFRTRLTHTLEAARLARCLARALRASELLAEAIVLAHDLGHPPFGHAGEKALAEAMAEWGGFNHNAHSLRVVTYLEHPFPKFRGLNLTRATLAGLAGHETRYDRPAEGLARDSWPDGSRASADGSLARARASSVTGASLAPSIEAQIGSMADRLAYNMHDLEDAIGAGLVDGPALDGLSLWRENRSESGLSNPEGGVHAIRRLVLDGVLNRLALDVLGASLRDVSGGPKSEMRPSSAAVAGDMPAGGAAVALSADGERRLAEVEQFLVERVYQHPTIAASDALGREMIVSLFAAYRRRPSALPERFRARITEQGLEPVIRDYIAGMTDRFCRAEWERLAKSAR